MPEALTTVDWINAGSAVAQVILVGFGAWVARRGLTTWRDQHRGQRDSELAEKALILSYQVADAIRGMRSPLSYASETAHVERLPNEHEEDYLARKTYGTAWIRYEAAKEIFAEMRVTTYAVLARFGPDLASPLNELRAVADDVLKAGARAAGYARSARQVREEATRREYIDRRLEAEAVYWWQGTEDETATRISQAASAIEEKLRPYIAAQART